MSDIYVQVRNGEIINLMVADTEYIKQQPRPDEFIVSSQIIGSKSVGSMIREDGVFYTPQPHPEWIMDGNGGWRPPLIRPNKWQNLTVSGHFGNTADQIHQFANYISEEISDSIVEFASSVPTEDWSTESTSSTYVMFSEDIREKSMDTWLKLETIANSIADTMNATFNVVVGTPGLAITKMEAGSFQVPHPDKRIDRWIYMDEYPPDNDLTAVAYYNENFSGGELFFPQYDLEISPTKGKVVAYPGDNEHLHGVKEVSEGTRYTTPFFFPIIELLG